MDPFQFSLFFVAILIGYVLVHLRLVRFETYLREMGGIKSLNERLQGVADGMDRIRVDAHEDLLRQAVEELQKLRQDVQRVERAQREFEPTGPVLIPGAEPSAGDRVRGLVEGRLLQMGYGDLKVLTDLSRARLDTEIDVVVECLRNGMPYKGKVRVRNNGVQGVEMQSVAAGFP